MNKIKGSAVPRTCNNKTKIAAIIATVVAMLGVLQQILDAFPGDAPSPAPTHVAADAGAP